jgi:hypothetical protein
MKIEFRKIGLVLATLMVSMPAMSAQVIPTSYSFDQATSCGAWCNYHDPNLTKLTDGVVGNVSWAFHEGVEWDGWRGKPVVNIDFSFAGLANINSVSIGSTQDHLADVVLPSFKVWALEANAWVLKGSLLNLPSTANNNDIYNNGGQHAFYTLANLDIHSQQVRVSAYANGPWTFVDEVRFTAAPVPETEIYAMLLAGLGLMGAVARRRKAV